MRADFAVIFTGLLVIALLNSCGPQQEEFPQPVTATVNAPILVQLVGNNGQLALEAGAIVTVVECPEGSADVRAFISGELLSGDAWINTVYLDGIGEACARLKP